MTYGGIISHVFCSNFLRVVHMSFVSYSSAFAFVPSMRQAQCHMDSLFLALALAFEFVFDFVFGLRFSHNIDLMIVLQAQD